MDLIGFLKAQWDRVLGWTLIVLGGLALLLGYEGIRESAFVAQQLSYLASGGIGGLWLVGVGATLLVTANVSDEWRKLDEVKDLIARVLELDGEDTDEASGVNEMIDTTDTPAAPGRTTKRVSAQRAKQLRAAGRVAAARHPDTGSTELTSVVLTSAVLAVISLAIVVTGWVRAAQAGAASDAFSATGFGAIGLPILGAAAATGIIRWRRMLRAQGGAAFAPFALVAEALVVEDAGHRQTNGTGWVRVPGSAWVHRSDCAMAAGREVDPADEGDGLVSPCPLCGAARS